MAKQNQIELKLVKVKVLKVKFLNVIEIINFCVFRRNLLLIYTLLIADVLSLFPLKYVGYVYN